MPTATALRSFDHNGPVRKGDTVTFDAVTMAALRRSGLVSKDDAEAPKSEPVAEIPKVAKPGKKSAALPAAPVSHKPIVTPSEPGALPPPPPVK